MRTSSNPLVTGIIVLLVLAGALYLAAGSGDGADDSGGGTLTAEDRAALDAAPVERGADPSGPAPALDPTDPVAVASAYVTAAYSLDAADAGHTNRRAVRFAAPGTPPATVGVLVVNAPPAGRSVTANVTDIEQVGADESGTRRGYVVGYRLREDPPGPPDPDRHTRFLLLIRQVDGRWTVAGDSPDGQVGEP
jgi:hypothetical protein